MVKLIIKNSYKMIFIRNPTAAPEAGTPGGLLPSTGKEVLGCFPLTETPTRDRKSYQPAPKYHLI
jgi:hypothetical protein